QPAAWKRRAHAALRKVNINMTIIFFLALIVYVIICGVLVSLILMQEGKGGGLSGVMGASMGETFGFGGASKQVRRYTAYCATAFLIPSMRLAFRAEAAVRGAESRFLAPGAGAPAAQPAPAPESVPAGQAAPAGQTEASAVAPPPTQGNAPSPGVVTSEQP